MSELQHPESRSFERVAELYERTRPTYPEEAVQWLTGRLGIDATAIVLDLGAGTGKLTRALVGLCARVLAVEPGPAMLAQLERAVPQAEPILGAAEAIPLGDNAVDAVTCGQSFHWFRSNEALREIERVLRPGGGLGLIWNVRDIDDPLQREITALLDRFVPSYRPPPRAWPDPVAEHDSFGELESHVVSFEQELGADELVERIASISFVAAAPPEDREQLEQSLRKLATEVGGRVPFRYVTRAYVTRAIPSEE